MKKISIALISLLLVGCISLNKRDEYSSTKSPGRYEEMPYFPTLTVQDSETIKMYKSVLTHSIIGIPILAVDYIGSIAIDTVCLPFDVHRNLSDIPKRKEYKEILNKREAVYGEAVKKLEKAKTKKEKEEIKSKYKKITDDYYRQLQKLDRDFTLFNVQRDLFD